MDYPDDRHLDRLREMQAEIEKLTAENTELRRIVEMYRHHDELVRLAQIAVNEAQEESRRLGVANVYFINGRTYYELPNGEYTMTPPQGYIDAEKKLRG